MSFVRWLAFLLFGLVACGAKFDQGPAGSEGGGGSAKASTSSGGGGGTTSTGGAGGAPGCPVEELVYDAFDDFDPANNPTDHWAYGMVQSGTFALYTVQLVENELETWRSEIGNDPNIVHNPTGQEIDLGFAFFPGEDYLHTHPGPNNELSTLRWIATVAGRYRVTVHGIPLNPSGTTTDIELVHNDDPLGGGEVDTANELTLDERIDIEVGDTVDLRCGWGADLSYGSDSTGVALTITGECPPP